ncbi:MAG: O-antigen ligase family protein [Campylobacterales bacterium]|nr:O-antigen ligase family protein [Campylobacterales bacterium]
MILGSKEKFLEMFRSVTYEKLFYFGAILFAFALPISRSIVSFFIVTLPILWFLQGNLKHKMTLIRNSPALIAITLFLIAQCVSLLYSEDIEEGLNLMRMYAYWLVIYVMAISFKKEWITTLISSFLYGMLVSEICAYLIFFDIYAVKGKLPNDPNPFMGHMTYSMFLAFTSLLLLNRIFSKHYTRIQKLFFVLFFTTVTVNLFISNGRTGQVAFLAALLVTVIVHFRFSWKSLIIFSFISLSIFAGAYKFLPHFEVRANHAISDIKGILDGRFYSSWGLRSAYWLITYEAIKESPLIGFGMGDFRLVAQSVLEKNPYNFSQDVIKHCEINFYDNQYLMVLVQSGFIGLALMVYLFYRLFALKIPDKELKELSIIFITVIMVAFLARHFWFRQFGNTLFVFMTGLIILASSEIPKQKEKIEKD